MVFMSQHCFYPTRIQRSCNCSFFNTFLYRIYFYIFSCCICNINICLFSINFFEDTSYTTCKFKVMIKICYMIFRRISYLAHDINFADILCKSFRDFFNFLIFQVSKAHAIYIIINQFFFIFPNSR